MTRASLRLRAKLDVLETLDHRALSAMWLELHNTPPPKAASRKFLIRSLAYELQTHASPALSKANQRQLDAAVRSNAGDKPLGLKVKTRPAPRPSLTLDPGSKLMREWNGKTHMVSVIEEGFVYKDRVWKSLSAIAKDITGAHWSGPRFFGLHGAQT